MVCHLGSFTNDRLIGGARLLAQELPEPNFLEQPGGHTWSTWVGGAKELFARIRQLQDLR